MKLLPEDTRKSWEMEMDPSTGTDALSMNGHIQSRRARAVAGIFCHVFAVLQLLGLACGLARFSGSGLNLSQAVDEDQTTKT